MYVPCVILLPCHKFNPFVSCVCASTCTSEHVSYIFFSSHLSSHVCGECVTSIVVLNERAVYLHYNLNASIRFQHYSPLPPGAQARPCSILKAPRARRMLNLRRTAIQRYVRRKRHRQTPPRPGSKPMKHNTFVTFEMRVCAFHFTHPRRCAADSLVRATPHMCAPCRGLAVGDDSDSRDACAGMCGVGGMDVDNSRASARSHL